MSQLSDYQASYQTQLLNAYNTITTTNTTGPWTFGFSPLGPAPAPTPTAPETERAWLRRRVAEITALAPKVR